jgi:Uma2 family endonuclease
MRRAPDWVIEVLSPATAAHDQTIKLAAYERAGVREVWFVHPADHVVTVYEHVGGGFARPTISEMRGASSPRALPEVSIDWARILACPVP